jgi:apolipoprotein D and lipocalin family protein
MSIPRSLSVRLLPILAAGAVAGCAASQSPLQTVDYVDLERFMGDWYVIANIPTFLEKEAYNAVESYEMKEDGSIATTFVFRKGGFDGKRKVHTPVGFVADTETNPKGFVKNTESNALWGMRFIWPIKADYRIVYLTDDYSQTVIARNKRDYVWVMARTPEIPDADYQAIVEMIAGMGYDVDKIQKVPQRW